MRIRTNNVPRRMVDASELTAAERAELDYLADDQLIGAMLVRYRGQILDLGEFQRCEQGGELANLGWHGFSPESYFTATVCRFVDNEMDYVVLGVALS